MVFNVYFESSLSLPNGYMKITRNGNYVWVQPYGLGLPKTVLVTTELLFSANSAAIRNFPRASVSIPTWTNQLPTSRLTTLRTFHHGADSTLALIQDILSLDMHLLTFRVMFHPKLILISLKNFLPTSSQILFLTIKFT